MGAPKALPDWLSDQDLEYYVNEFTRTGFGGGLNYYRNFDRNHELMSAVNPVLKVPALFIVGEKDVVIAGLDRDQLESRMRPFVPELRHIEWLEGAGHWIQQERPEECNRALLDFLTQLG
jgi:pimeloyl-ACP methyl ester carboxylesterase